jgi:EAL domain-containing protein (putative c-di-GMP-specific phosphodiesterase class I)
VISGHELRVTTSIGISIFPTDGADEQALSKNADIAMYHAKSEGKNNYQFFSAEINNNSLERLTLESGLRRALANNEFQLVFQAKRELCSNRIVGAEALLRWRHPELGILLPGRFISLAEETGLIVDIGKWVIWEACRQLVQWRMQGLPPLSIAVNLSARQFADEHLLDEIKAILAATGADPSRLEIEITESLLMLNVERAIATLKALKSLGIRIAIDDFGTGYSSLSMLRQFPLDAVKIDRSFISDITASSDDDDVALTDAIIAMGKALHLTVVAEGVESEVQERYLRKRSCDQFQGYYLNVPFSAEMFVALLQHEGGLPLPV